MNKPGAAFICVHNSCRSQIAEAFGRQLASDVFIKIMETIRARVLELRERMPSGAL